ncbi:MAG TPA: LysR family transcriptional regulator [Burkholderiales bacterium]|nr:LysR family transcriptional regulator [Burkholderiales bacterium]
MHLEANDLLLFARVVESGSLSRAAEALGMPTSTVSRRISALEAQVGERLIQRTTRKLSVTELGQVLLDHARRVAEGVEGAAALADHRQEKPSGRLRVSMPADIANTLFSPVIAEFSAAYPSITLDLDISMRRVDLIGEGYDIAVRLGPSLEDDATLSARKVGELNAALYASPRYLKERGTPGEPANLLDHLALCALRGGEPLLWVLRKNSERWEGLGTPRIAANSPDMLMRLAMMGAGIAMCEQRIADHYVKLRQLVRVLPDWESPPVPMWAVFPGRKLMPARTRVFIDALVAQFKGSGSE